MGKKSFRKRAEQELQQAQQTTTINLNTSSHKQFKYIQAAIILLFGFLLYANTITHDYAVDDMIVVQKNKLTQKGFEGIADIMTTDAFYGFFGEDYKFVAGGRYRPLSIVTLAIEVELFGSNQPHISHFINAFLYSITCVLIFLLLLHLFRQYPSSALQLTVPFIATLLYTAHPIHTEVVANIKGRDEIMGMLFSILTLLFSVKYILKKNVLFLALTFISFILALLSKENAITFLAVVPLTIYFFTSAKIKDHAILVVPMLVIAGIYVVLRQKFTGVEISADTTEILNNPFVNATYGEQLATVAYTFWEYWRLQIFPHPLTHDYYFNQVPIVSWNDVKAIFPFFLNAAIVGWALLKLKSKNVFSYAILYYFVTISIVSNVLFTVGIAMNERFVFMSSLGFCIILALALVKLSNYIKEKKWQSNEVLNPSTTMGILALILLGYSAKTFSRNLDWKNDFTLFAADYKNSPNSAKIKNSYGGELVTQSDKVEEPLKTEYLKKAEVVLGEALKIYPNYLNALLLIGNAKYKLYDSVPEAKYYYEQTIRLKPDYFEGNFNLGCVLIAKNYAKESIPYFRKALIKGADKYEVWFNTGDAYFKTNNADSAIYFYQGALKLKPDLGAAYYKIGLSYARYKNDFANGFANLNKAIELEPNNHVYYEDLGVAYGMSGNYEAAIKIFEKGISIKADHAPFYNDLGITYKQMGNEAKAQEFFAKAQQVAGQVK
jgi:tetratricopeptide (TPR) repeat protein